MNKNYDEIDLSPEDEEALDAAWERLEAEDEGGDTTTKIAQHMKQAADQDAWFACFTAALDSTQDIDKSLEVADEVSGTLSVTEGEEPQAEPEQEPEDEEEKAGLIADIIYGVYGEDEFPLQAKHFVFKGDSYFADCPRDELGHCKESGQGDTETAADASEAPQEEYVDPRTLLSPKTDEQIAQAQKFAADTIAHFHNMVDEKAAHLDEAKRQHYKESFKRVIEYMTPPMMDLIKKNVGDIEFYDTVADLTEKFNRTGKGIVGGCFESYSTDRVGTLHLDGGENYIHSTAGIYAHEMAHALDFRGRFSRRKEWQEAYAEEIYASGELTEYAKTNPVEGFAEYVRLMNEMPREARKEFPKCWACFKSWGLV